MRNTGVNNEHFTVIRRKWAYSSKPRQLSYRIKKRITARCVSPYSTDNDQTQNYHIPFTTALQTKFRGNLLSIFRDAIDLCALTARMTDTHGLFFMC